MKTRTLKLSKAAIEQHQASSLTTLRDTVKSRLYFRYNTARTGGTFYLVKREPKGAPKWHALGRWPELSVHQAHLAYEARYERLCGQLPYVDTGMKIRTVHELFDWQIRRRTRETHFSANTIKSTHTALNRVKTVLADRPVLSLTESVLDEQLYQPFLDCYALSTFELTLKIIKAAYRQAYHTKMIAANPLAEVHYSHFTTVRPKPKACRVEDYDVPHVLHQIRRAPLRTRMLMCWVLMHATRINETCHAHRDRLINNEWLIRESESKTQLNLIPLTDIAEQMLKEYARLMRKQSSRCRYLFFQSRHKRTHISGNQGTNLIREAAKGKFSPHDLRKYARAWWQNNGVDYFVGELLLGHKVKGMNAVYIQTVAKEACRQGLTRWHQHLVTQGLFLALWGDEVPTTHHRFADTRAAATTTSLSLTS